jgi:protein tyrosine phosphatase
MNDLYKQYKGERIKLTPEEVAVVVARDAHPPAAFDESEVHKAYVNAALAEIEKLDAVNAAVASMSVVKQQFWEYASHISPVSKDVVAVCDALEIDRESLFIRARELRSEQGGDS